MFVDFDNVYTGLQSLDPSAAERFATDPGAWVAAIAAADGGAGGGRRFLIRNCYLNPSVYSKYRLFWTRAGFRVMDCPSLTQQGKSSTDINLVLDAMDVLGGRTDIDEFFIASADADFTSLVQRFRAADRRTTVIVAGAVAAAYREMADTVIQSFELLAMLAGAASAAAPPANVPGPIALVPGGVGMHSAGVLAVLDFVVNAPGPVKGALVAHRALVAEPSLGNDWAGHGKFGAWISQIGERIQYSSRPAPGWVWDAKRFSQQDLPLEAAAVPAVEEQVPRVTDVPALSTAQYRQVFLAMESKLRLTTNRNELAKMVRDACVASGAAVSRSAVNFVIQGLIYVAGALNGEATARELATAWTQNVEAICSVTGMEFNDEELSALRHWAGGGLLDAEPSGT